ncbi:flagellar basal-body rod protein FlgG [Photobacterium gaetbulicola]|uniref:Flagellar basal-body rod protein FlgG n=2 Tax=Photobacterium gaetbulicola TaxID=1295392 RepID=A0A0C5WKW7_9GAMM|nr:MULTISPECIES: flagellar basal-body rod protein FlgG [Photobacterium]AJR07798.1 flagellar basal body rod protein [Photobacterium gaetbulicola Gung47]KHT62903.1 flagellar basal body rod protein FlgG [Photobacterium gaetbulicola]PSU03406.1 flagellar basal-body rod protein FlgG [Photobacterium gaetbulicola]WEM42998.1 flagellar basal-body rod protein FlgG [Photobacterium sp. DA100]
MNAALWISKTGLAAQDTKMATISNNLANVNTVGFKRDRVAFEDLFYQIQRQPGAMADEVNELPSGIQLGSGVRVIGTQKVFTEGMYQTTNQSLDIAIDGQGFFELETPDGEQAFTRNGQFHLNSDGLIVNAQGLPLAQQIQVPQDAETITIGRDGIVSAKIAGDEMPQEIGQITLANFINPAGLEALGGNMFRATASSGEVIDGIAGEGAFGQIKQGVLEGSNVQVVEEMVDMITTQRGYEMNAKALSSSDEMLQYISQVL